MRRDTPVEMVLPGRCASCGAWGSVPLCGACATSVRWSRRSVRAATGSVDRAAAACDYEGAAREALKAFKLLGERRAARWLAARMLTVARPLGAEVVTWVPSTRAAVTARGFNPAEELARPLARSLRLPARRLLAKRRETLDSAGLSRAQRAVNLHGAFRARGRVADHVLLVDDVLTTGATAEECAAALKRAGARQVSVVTFARTR